MLWKTYNLRTVTGCVRTSHPKHHFHTDYKRYSWYRDGVNNVSPQSHSLWRSRQSLRKFLSVCHGFRVEMCSWVNHVAIISCHVGSRTTTVWNIILTHNHVPKNKKTELIFLSRSRSLTNDHAHSHDLAHSRTSSFEDILSRGAEYYLQINQKVQKPKSHCRSLIPT